MDRYTIRRSASSSLPTSTGDRRRLTELLRSCERDDAQSWARAALCACLRQVHDGRLTETQSVIILEARTLDPVSFEVIFHTPFLPDSKVGLRAGKGMPLPPEYLLDPSENDIADSYGVAVADFGIGLPIGAGDVSAPDERGVVWVSLSQR